MKGNVSTWRDFCNEVVGGSSPFCVFVDRYVVVVVVVEVVVVELIVDATRHEEEVFRLTLNDFSPSSSLCSRDR